MADPISIVPYDDPHDNLFSTDVVNYLNIQNPTLTDLTTQEISFSYPSSVPQSSRQIVDESIDPLQDPVTRDFCNEPNAVDSQAASLGFCGEMNNQRETNLGLNNVNSMPISVWPSEPVPFGCSCCHVLREIIHANGVDLAKLEIHGRLGVICHAILNDQKGGTNAVTPGFQYQIFDFCNNSIEDVKQFLTQYCMDRSLAGYIMIKDPLSFFYEALCVGFVWDGNLCNGSGNFTQPSSSNSGAFQMGQAGNSSNQEKPPKPSSALQRERTRNLTLKEIENYFHLPIQEAAEQMEFSNTLMKKICCKFGVTTWPRRKLQSVEKKISKWASRLTEINDPEQRVRAENEFQSLQPEIARFGEGLSKQADDW